jgi:hypothetical protein
MAGDPSRSITHWRAGITDATPAARRLRCHAAVAGANGKKGACVRYQIVGVTIDTWRINVQGKLSDQIADTRDLGG